MAHVAKYTKGSCGGLTKHFERAKDEEGRYYRFKNQEIDLERTPLNYNLAPHNEKQLEFIKNRLENVYCMKREDVKVMCSWVVTIPQTVPEEHEREFFERTYKFLEERYGKENVVSAYVHKDETTPHMHFAFIPVVYDKKKKREKVSAKEVLTKTDLRAFHTDLQAEMDRFCEAHENEFECDVLNGATENGNLTVQGLKAKDLQAENEELKFSNEIEMDFLEQIAEKVGEETDKLYKAQEELEAIEAKKSTLESEIKALNGDINALEERKADLQLEVLTWETKSNLTELSLFRKFLSEHPKIKEMFENWCNGMRQHAKSRLDEFKASIDRKRDGNPFGQRENPFERSSKGISDFERL